MLPDVPQPRGRSRPKPGTREAPEQKVQQDRPVVGDDAKRNRARTERQRGRNHDQAHRLVQDHRLQRGEAERPDQEGKPELGPAQPDQPAQRSNDGTAEKRARQAALVTVFGVICILGGLIEL